MIDDLARVTPRERVAAALEALGEASASLGDGKYHAAVRHATKAKELAPRDATVRETLGLAAYRVGDWGKALSELRAYRRMSGETTHIPIEMDVLRALKRPADVEKMWVELERRGGRPGVQKEGLVVYASHLIDAGDAERALELTVPERTTGKVFPEDLRIWYVAARAAALAGQPELAGRLRNAILEHDPSLPGIDDLESTLRRSGR
ncbi:MAG: tetratricopeptide repeat protein [Acidimicrobiia bacterium]